MRKTIKIGKYRIRKKVKNSSVQENGQAYKSEFERKKEELKMQRKKLKIKRKLIVFLFFLVAFATTVTVFKAPFFNIKGIVCVGQERLTEEEILEYANVKKGRNIFITNLGEVKSRLKNIPYVKESNARRIFPDKIKLWVRECTPAFVVKDGNKFVVCDVNTKVLEIIPENKDNLCIVTLPELPVATEGNVLLDESDSKCEKIIECFKTLEELELINMTTSIDFTDISDIIIVYDERLKIKLGNTNDINYKLKFISEVMKKNISEHEKATIDYTGETLYVGQFEEDVPEKGTENEENNNEKINIESKEQNDENSRENEGR